VDRRGEEEKRRKGDVGAMLASPFAELRDSWQLYWRYTLLSLRAQLQYRASFLLMTLGNLMISGAEFLGIAVLFARFGNIQGWKLAEIALLFGVINVGFAFAEAASRGFDVFGDMVKSGEFDRILLRPRSTAFQIAAQELQLMRVGRLIQGLAVLIWSIAHLNLVWTVANILLLPLMIFGTACLFYGLFVLQATVCFWTVESIEIINIATYGGTEVGQYPLTIYRPLLRHIFTWVIPLASVNFLPASLLMGRSDASFLLWFAPLIGVLFLCLMLQLWNVGVRKYCSTGS
jgi:ABC-2 type transport system permease protein